MHDRGDGLAAHSASPGRRRFLQAAVLGGGASLLAATWPVGVASAQGGTDALLLSCMDYRLTDNVEQYMRNRGLGKKYDHVILAGAALGALTDKYPAWNTTFWEHLGVAIELHSIHKVFVMDHRDCGAYKVILGEDLAKDRKKETEVHTAKLRELRTKIMEKHPKLAVELLLMSLSGKVERIT